MKFELVTFPIFETGKSEREKEEGEKRESTEIYIESRERGRYIERE
jgi:hypothetical protein